MNNFYRTLIVASAFIITFSSSAAALTNDCSQLYTQSSADFTKTLDTDPNAAASYYPILAECVANNACANSNTPDMCMQNLIPYKALAFAAYNKKKLVSSAAPSVAPTTAPQAANNFISSAPVTQQQAPITYEMPANNNNDIYKNIRF